MIQRLFVFILVTAFASVSYAQDAPKPGSDQRVRSATLYRAAIGGAGGYLGVELKEVSNANYQQLGLTSVRGVAVERVLRNTPAEKAGLQNGDVIVAFNGEAITSGRKLTRLIGEVAPDHTVNLTVVRGGGEFDIPVTMGERKGLTFIGRDFDFPAPPSPPSVIRQGDGPMLPMPPLPPMAPDVPVFPRGDMEIFGVFSGRHLGLRVTPITKQLGDYFGVEGGKGLLINDVMKDSPAERAGLKAGDVIVEIDGKDVRNQMDLYRSTDAQKEGEVILTIVRDRIRQTISVTPEARKDGRFLLNGYEFNTREKESN